MADELRETRRDLDDWRARPKGFGVEVVEHEPSLRPERQPDRHESPGPWIHRIPGEDLELQEPVRTLPRSHALPRIPVRQERLTEHRVLEHDPGRIISGTDVRIELCEMGIRLRGCRRNVFQDLADRARPRDARFLIAHRGPQ